jgi:flagellar biogenesis protein FliO
MGRRRAGGLLEVLETLPLGNRRYLMLLRMGDRRGLLSVAGDRVALLDELPGETFDRTLARAAPGEEVRS